MPLAYENVAFGELKCLISCPFNLNYGIYDFLGLHASLPKTILHFAT